MKPSGRRSDCPISFALDVFGDRWTMLVVRDLVFMGKRRFGEFVASEEGIATNILASRLARLEQHGIVTSAPDPDNRRSKLYTLTPKGLAMIPILIELIVWGATWDPDTGAPAAFVRRAREDRAGLIREIADRLRAGQTESP